ARRPLRPPPERTRADAPMSCRKTARRRLQRPRTTPASSRSNPLPLRPEPTPARSMSDDADVERKVAASLEELGAPFELLRIDPDFADTAAFCEKYGIPLDHSANTIIVASKKEPKQYCACVVLATTRLDVNHAVKKLMGVSRVSFASAEETMALTGMRIGGVTVFALPPDVPLYVDERLMALDWLILGGGGRDSKIRTSPEVF